MRSFISTRQKSVTRGTYLLQQRLRKADICCKCEDTFGVEDRYHAIRGTARRANLLATGDLQRRAEEPGGIRRYWLFWEGVAH